MPTNCFMKISLQSTLHWVTSMYSRSCCIMTKVRHQYFSYQNTKLIRIYVMYACQSAIPYVAWIIQYVCFYLHLTLYVMISFISTICSCRRWRKHDISHFKYFVKYHVMDTLIWCLKSIYLLSIVMGEYKLNFALSKIQIEMNVIFLIMRAVIIVN